MNKTLPLALAITLFCLTPPAYAQSWLDKLGSLFGNSGTSQSTDNEAQDAGLLKNVGGLLSDEDLANGFKEALRVGSEHVVHQLSQENGFNNDDAIHIPLPKNLRKARSLLERIGMEYLADDLELKLNRAAEAATPEAKRIFIQAIQSITFEDVRNIYGGDTDAATEYFRHQTSDELSELMRPIIESSLADVGALAVYQQFTENYRSIPFVPDLKGNLTDYALSETLDGVFYYLAREEAAIRENPVKRTTELLQRVFEK